MTGGEGGMDSSPSGIGSQAVSRKSPCRYGRGCTHILDPTHLEKFRHPAKQELNGVIICFFYEVFISVVNRI